MADLKISQLPSATTPLAGTEVLPIVQTNTTKQVSIANLTAGRSISAADVTVSTGNLVIGTSGKGIEFTDFTVKSDGAGTFVNTGKNKAIGYVGHNGVNGANYGSAFNIYWTGNAQLWIDNTFVGDIQLLSDYRIKRNVETIQQSCLDRIAQLRPVTYQRADFGDLFYAENEVREGFIAHELQAIIPSAVQGEKDAKNQIQSLKLDALCAVLVKAVQELKVEVDFLKTKV